MQIQALLLLPVVAFLLTWAFLLSRKMSGKEILPKQNPLHRARWRGDACFMILGMFITFPAFALSCAMYFSQMEKDSQQVKTSEKVVTMQQKETGTEHPALVFLQKNPSAFKFFFMTSYVVLIVPFLEEFIFRLIIQGWLDAREREIFRRFRFNGILSVILTAIIFSLLHFRKTVASQPSESYLGVQFYTLAVASIFVLFFSIWLLKSQLQLTWREIGLDFRFWKKDLCLGGLGFGAAAWPTYMIQGTLAEPLRPYCAPDFIALLPIALAFGILYWRTRRLLPGITAHAIFNGYSVMQLFILYLAQK